MLESLSIASFLNVANAQYGLCGLRGTVSMGYWGPIFKTS